MSKKNGYKAAHTCKVPLYGGEVDLFLSQAKMTAAVEQLGATLSVASVAGQFARLERKGGRERLYLVGVFEGGLSTLTHELGHVALDILQVAGIDAHSGNGEPFCYLLGHLFDECAPAVAKKVMRS